MCQVAQPSGTFLAVAREHGIDRFLLVQIQIASVALWFVGNRKFTMVRGKEVRRHGSVRPSFDPLCKKWLFVPHERPSLRVVYEFLQLHGGHRSRLVKYVVSYVKNICHSRLSTKPPVAQSAS